MPVIADEKEEAFATAVVKIADPKSYQQLIKRNRLTEGINYTRNTDKYLVIDGMDLIADKGEIEAGSVGIQKQDCAAGLCL
jgi:hypothetical protein